MGCNMFDLPCQPKRMRGDCKSRYTTDLGDFSFTAQFEPPPRASESLGGATPGRRVAFQIQVPVLVFKLGSLPWVKTGRVKD